MKQLSLITSGIMLSLSLTAQNNWQLKKDQDGIKVYTKSAENSHYDELKVETTLTATLSSLAALILDIDNYQNWSFNTEKAYVLKKVGPGDLYFYTLIHSPWPASDRDLPFIYRSARTRVPNRCLSAVPAFPISFRPKRTSSAYLYPSNNGLSPPCPMAGSGSNTILSWTPAPAPPPG
jgi:hypothetical protein